MIHTVTNHQAPLRIFNDWRVERGLHRLPHVSRRTVNREGIGRRQQVREEDIHCCYCDEEIAEKDKTVEHLLPKSKIPEGMRYLAETPQNLTVCCRRCNEIADDFLGDFMEKREFVRQQIHRRSRKGIEELAERMFNTGTMEDAMEKVTSLKAKAQGEELTLLEFIQERLEGTRLGTLPSDVSPNAFISYYNILFALPGSYIPFVLQS